MADLHLLAFFCGIGPDVLTGGVRRIVSGPGIDLVAYPGLGNGDIHIGILRPAARVAHLEGDIMPSRAEVISLQVLAGAQVAVPAGMPEKAAGLPGAGAGGELNRLSPRECAHIFRSKDRCSFADLP